ncbi:MAG: 4-(cytidine 5'-diphospho)-2-C-methyl-D-erythritol kinase [Robiginitomaculum sp.]
MNSSAKTYTQIARAKINLTLHVGPAQRDGYHPLHSLVVFADIGDVLNLVVCKKQKQPNLEISGPFGCWLGNGRDNTVMQIAMAVNDIHIGKPNFHLIKNLPVASGMGGGTSDAATAWRMVTKQYQCIDTSVIQKMGADFTVCLFPLTVIMEGIGHELTPLSNKRQVASILVNPGTVLNTDGVFKAFDETGCSTQPNASLRGSLLEMAKNGRNDLQDIAIKMEPIIQTVLDGITAQDGCELARMSGSGASCFGLFKTMDQARFAAKTIKAKYPNWWCVPTLLGDKTEEAKQ